MRRRWVSRALYLLAVTLVSAGLAHLGSVLALPYRSKTDAYAGLSAAAGGATLTTVAGSATTEGRPFRDAAMAEAFCLYDLRQGPVTASLDVTAADFVVLSVHDRHGRVLSGLTNRSATQNRLALTVVMAEEVPHRPTASEAAAQEIRVEADEPQGFVLAQSLAVTPSQGRAAAAGTARLSCRTARP